MSKHAGVVRLFAIAAVISATTVFAEGTPGPDSALAARVADYWEAISTRDLSTAYRLEKQAHAREIDPLDYFEKGSTGFPLRAARIDGIEQNGDRATATISAATLIPLGGRVLEVPRQFKSEWERLDGDWYHVESKQVAVVAPPKASIEGSQSTPVDQAPPVVTPTPGER